MMSENKGMEISQTERLSAAIRAGNADGVKAFIDAGGDVNCRNLDNVTPLHTAAQYGDLDIVRMLVGAGADVFATVKTQYDEDYSAADIAYSCEHREVFDFIRTVQQEQIQKRRDAHKVQREKLFSAINAQQPDIVREAVAEVVPADAVELRPAVRTADWRPRSGCRRSDEGLHASCAGGL